MTVHEKALIMEADDMERVLRRIAIEIVERNKGLTDVVLLGVQRRGVTLAHRLREIFRQTEKVRVPTGELDVTRRPRNILTFSHGAHHCLGAAAARMQSRVALTELMARCPNFEVDESGVVWAGGSYVRRPLSVPFTVT